MSAKLRDWGDADRDVERAAKLLEKRGIGSPALAVVLGSGLSSFGEDVQDPVVVPYADVPGLPAPAVSGHAGSVVAGRLGGRQAIVFAGRVHHYEDRAPSDVTFAVRLVGRLGELNAGVFERGSSRRSTRTLASGKYIAMFPRRISTRATATSMAPVSVETVTRSPSLTPRAAASRSAIITTSRFEIPR